MILLPRDDTWVPSRADLESLLQYLHIDRVDGLTGYAHPLDWRRQDELEVPNTGGIIWQPVGTSLWRLENLPAAIAIDQWQIRGALVTLFCCAFQDWAKSLSTIPEASTTHISGERPYVAWEVVLTVGPWDESHYDRPATKARGHFHLAIGGYRCPSDPDEYLLRFERIPPISELTDWITNKTGTAWNWIWNIT